MKKAVCLLLLITVFMLYCPYCPASSEPDFAAPDVIVERAFETLGKPYQWGAAGPDSYDCSGLVSYCLTGTHAHLYTAATFLSWPRTSSPQPGDICTNGYHCGIYIGAGTMIHAETFGTVVRSGPVHSGMIIVSVPNQPIPVTGDQTVILPSVLLLIVSVAGLCYFRKKFRECPDR